MDRITKAIELAREKNLKKLAQKSAAQPAIKTQGSVGQVAEITTTTLLSRKSVLEKHGIITESLDGAFADAYRLLRTRVLQRMRQNDWRTLGITSSHPKAGKSYTAVNLSVAISLDQNYRSLLVDADMRRPSIKEYLGIEPPHGLGEYLGGHAELNQVTYDVGIEHFKVIPTAKSIEGTSELLGSPKMSGLIRQLKESDDAQITIFDLPPTLVGDDVVTLTSQLDAVLLIVEDGGTQSDELQRAVELLKDVNVIGSVLNKATQADTDKYGAYY